MTHIFLRTENLRKYQQRIPKQGGKLDLKSSFKENVLYQLLYPDLKTLKLVEATKPRKDILATLFFPKVWSEKRMDWLLSISDFSHVVVTNTESYNFYTCKGLQSTPKLQNVVSQFDIYTWMGIIASFLLVYGTAFASVKLLEGNSKFRFPNFALELAAPIFNAGSDSCVDNKLNNSTKTYLRFLLALWFLTMLVMNNVYQIIVISDIIEPLPLTIPWKSIVELPLNLKKYAVVDQSLSTLTGQLKFLFLKPKSRTYVLNGKSFIQIPNDAKVIGIESVLFNASHKSILTWHLSPFGRFVRDDALKCAEIFENQKSLEIKFCLQLSKVLLTMFPQLSMNVSALLTAIQSKCSNAIFIDTKENVDLISNHFNELARRKYFLKGSNNQPQFEMSVSWAIKSFFGHKHGLTVRLERFMESGVLDFVKLSLKAASQRNLGRETIFKMKVAAQSMGLDSSIVIIFYIHCVLLAILVCSNLCIAFIRYVIDIFTKRWKL